MDGKVIFDSKLREGTYYLKETQAPDGYVRSTERWTVEVKKVSETGVSVTLKDSSEIQLRITRLLTRLNKNLLIPIWNIIKPLR